MLKLTEALVTETNFGFCFETESRVSVLFLQFQLQNLLAYTNHVGSSQKLVVKAVGSPKVWSTKLIMAYHKVWSTTLSTYPKLWLTIFLAHPKDRLTKLMAHPKNW